MRFKNFQWVYGGIRCAGFGIIPSLYGAMWQFLVWNPVDMRAEEIARNKKWLEEITNGN